MGKDLKGKELGKGISQRKDGRYEARVVINGKRITVYNTKLADLKREFEKEKEKLSRQNIVKCQDATLTEWFDAWFEKYKKPTLKPSGVKAYYRKFSNTYGKMLGNVMLTELNQFSIQSATSELINSGYKFKSIRDSLVTEERRVLSNAEQKQLLDITDNTFYRELYRFMLCTGLRVGEVGALRWSDIDFENEIIYVKHTLSCQYDDGVKTMEITTPKTKNSFRKVPFFNETKQILLDQKKKQKELKSQLKERWRGQIDDLVFTTSMGSPVTRYVLQHDMRQITREIQMSELYNAMQERREVKEFEAIHPHCLRHTFATRCFEKGMDAKMVQQIMGHANINMTMSYTHVLDDMMKKEAKKIGSFLDDNFVA